MRFPDEISSTSFLSDTWQKRVLFMQRALDVLQPNLEPDELAWLATQDDVESRIVMTNADGESTRYDVDDGPFDEQYFSQLPAQNWTLLVQDVEKHLPDFRALFAAVDFIPDWRIDDLMVSYAAPGGGVGPHRDNYDVFLCQSAGEREWRIGNAMECRPDEAGGRLSLLMPFDDQQPYLASPGDVLYLPPAVPHWGIARDPCMTWSIGMRAPNVAELKACAHRLLEDAGIDVGNSSPGDADIFYADPDLGTDEAEPGLISQAAIRRAGRLLGDAIRNDENLAAIVLGCVVTDPKAWLAPESISEEEAKALVDAVAPGTAIAVHGMTRIAYCETKPRAQAFANGHSRPLSGPELELFRKICRDRVVIPAQARASGGRGLLEWLLGCGVLDLTEPLPGDIRNGSMTIRD